jgi:rod shape-determining protein MreC
MAALAIFLALAVAVGLFVIYWRAPPGAPLRRARGLPDTVSGAAGSLLAAPMRWIDDGVDAASDYVFAAEENAELKRRLRVAETWRDRAAALGYENTRLRALLGVRTDPPLPMVFAHTVLDAQGPFSNSRLADAGSARGVIEGNPVLSDHGLVGRVVGVAPGVSRIMLLTDVQSRTPVLIVRTNGRAILAGDGGGNPVLTYLRSHDALRDGDRILTSGDGGVIPRGLPVGTVARGVDGLWRVALDSDAAPLDDVRILLFRDFSQLAPPDALAPRSLPSLATGAPPPPPPAPVPALVKPAAAKP